MVGWLVGWLFGWLVSWLVSWLHDKLCVGGAWIYLRYLLHLKNKEIWLLHFNYLTNTEKNTSLIISQVRQCMYKSNVEALSCNKYHNGKTYSGCGYVFLPHLSSIQNTYTLLYCHVWPVRLYHIFPHYIINGTIFGIVMEHKIWVFIFLTNFSWNISILRRSEWDMQKNINCSSCKLSVIHALF